MNHIQELADIIEKYTGIDGTHKTAIPSLSFYRMSQTSQPHYSVCEPAVCIIVQGKKQMFVGGTVFPYDASMYLVISLDIPVLSEVIEASPEKPLLCVVFSLDPSELTELMIDNDFLKAKRESPSSAVTLSPLTEDLTDAFVRLILLLDSPSDIFVLAPLIEKEILYRLLRGNQSTQISQIAFADSKLHRINRAITWIKKNFDKPIAIDTLAVEVGMSRSGLHKNFNKVTGLSPIQYQKQIRLQEARKIMLRRGVDSATASYVVGYESPSQFNREYKRFFGSPPHSDIAQIRAEENAVE